MPERAERSPHDADVLPAFREHLFRNAFFPKDSTILVGVSGRSDSVALLRLLATVAPDLQITLLIGHVQRDDAPEAHDDAAFVRHLADTLALPLDILAAESSSATYEPFWKTPLIALAERRGAYRIATAETREDCAERLLHAVMGSSAQLERLLVSVEEPFVRPVLPFSHEACVTYLTQRSFAFRAHPHALALDTLPARIRLLLLPLLERHLDTHALSNLATASEVLNAERAFIDTLAPAAREDVHWQQHDARIALERAHFIRLPLPLRYRLLFDGAHSVTPAVALTRSELLHLDTEIQSLASGEERRVGRLKVSRSGGILTLHSNPVFPRP